MKKETLIQLYKESWNDVKKILPNDLPLPYLAIGDVKDEFNESRKSVNLPLLPESEEKLNPDVPSTMFFSSEGVVAKIKMYYAGTLMTPNCLKYTDLEIKAGIVHEQVHEVLRCSALIYGLTNVFSKYPEIQNVFDEFDEFVAHGFSSIIFEYINHTKEDYFSAPIKAFNPVVNEFYGIKNNENLSIEDRIKNSIKEQQKFDFIAEKISPIKEFHKFFEIYLQLFTPTELHENVRSAYFQMAKTSYTIERRLFDGTWKYICPITIPIQN